MAYEGLDLTDHVAVVIGGTSGLGKAIALGLAEAGADVVAASRREAQVAEVATAIEARGRQTLRLTADVSDRATLDRLLAETLKAFGKVDILVNAAGRTKKGATLDFPEADWSAILDTNLNGTLRACQVFGRPMLERGYGRIINIASLTSYRGFYQVAAYSASKAAVVSLTQTLGVEWAQQGVCVNAIAPGVFPTDLNRALLEGTERGRELVQRTPMQRFGAHDEIAGAAVFLASPAARFVTGEVLAVDGGFLASGVNT